MSWWREGVFYEIYPRSFADSNGDGIGDLAGVIERLDYLEWLGIDGIWLNPTFPSPNADWGYDVADYRDVHPDLGTLADLDRLVAEAGRRGIRILLDLVPNHTSHRHPWFLGEHRDWYVWSERKTNWLAAFGGSAWTYDRGEGRYYLHNFLPEQPDLNWWSPAVREAFDAILRFWLERGIAGFRIDVVHRIVKRLELVDLPGRDRRKRFPPVDDDETHAVIRRWRAVADAARSDGVLLGETYVLDVEEIAPFYGKDDELHLAFNFPFVFSRFGAASLRTVVEQTEVSLPASAWPAWTGSNHDVGRFATRWCGGDERKARCALVMLLTLRGTPFLYAGDELGLENADVPAERTLDCGRPPRDPGRTPMPWSAEPGAGFTRAGVEPWLPFGSLDRNVAAQRDDPESTLSLCRALIALRREVPELRSGSYASLPAPRGVWAWRRGEGVAVAVNMSSRPHRVELEGETLLSTSREPFGGRLDPWQAVVLRLAG
jgi:alpha-glucosidase